MGKKATKADIGLLAYACWIMGDMSTRDTAWSDKEIDAYARTMNNMATMSKSADVKAIAKHLIANIEDIRYDDSVYEEMQDTLAKCQDRLGGLGDDTSIRFLYWLLQIGREVSQAQPKGWFSGGGDPEKVERAKGMVLLSICPMPTLKTFIDEGKFNLPSAIDLWVVEHGQ